LTYSRTGFLCLIVCVLGCLYEFGFKARLHHIVVLGAIGAIVLRLTLPIIVATVLPQVIQPDPREIYVTLTANCNLRCLGCRYGRDFMPGAQLPWPILNGLLEDCSALGIRNVRLYGGEPLLHKDLPRIVERAVNLGLSPWLTTNGILLKDKIDALYSAGLRSISIGFYGTGKEYNQYVQRQEQYRKLEQSVEYVRNRYGMNVDLVLGWVLMRPIFGEHFSPLCVRSLDDADTSGSPVVSVCG
jgi:hypothetical protein